jgi:hypothetical protein
VIIVCPRRCRRRLSRASAVSSSGNLTLLPQAAPGPKYKAAFATAYGAGLHVSKGKEELVGLIDGARKCAPSWKELSLDLKRRSLAMAPELE